MGIAVTLVDKPDLARAITSALLGLGFGWRDEPKLRLPFPRSDLEEKEKVIRARPDF